MSYSFLSFYKLKCSKYYFFYLRKTDSCWENQKVFFYVHVCTWFVSYMHGYMYMHIYTHMNMQNFEEMF
jgi:hypothetical protein